MEIPSTYKTAAICQMISGVLTIMVSGGLFLSLIWICIGVLWLVPMAIGAWQIYVGWQMHNGERVANAQTVAIVNAITAFLSGSLISVALSGFAYMQLNEPEAKAFLEG